MDDFPATVKGVKEGALSLALPIQLQQSFVSADSLLGPFVLGDGAYSVNVYTMTVSPTLSRKIVDITLYFNVTIVTSSYCIPANVCMYYSTFGVELLKIL